MSNLKKCEQLIETYESNFTFRGPQIKYVSPKYLQELKQQTAIIEAFADQLFKDLSIDISGRKNKL
jgi:hypothetical protein